jgi:hypothetical protein
VNTLPGNLKSSLQGTYHGFKFDKYAARYLAEVQYRFNRRFDLPRMIPRLHADDGAPGEVVAPSCRPPGHTVQK